MGRSLRLLLLSEGRPLHRKSGADGQVGTYQHGGRKDQASRIGKWAQKHTTGERDSPWLQKKRHSAGTKLTWQLTAVLLPWRGDATIFKPGYCCKLSRGGKTNKDFQFYMYLQSRNYHLLSATKSKQISSLVAFYCQSSWPLNSPQRSLPASCSFLVIFLTLHVKCMIYCSQTHYPLPTHPIFPTLLFHFFARSQSAKYFSRITPHYLAASS